MEERLTITTTGRQRLVDRIKDCIWGAIYNLPLSASDEERAVAAANAMMVEGKHEVWDRELIDREPSHGQYSNPRH